MVIIPHRATSANLLQCAYGKPGVLSWDGNEERNNAEETQHRLLMCMRMAKALGKGEIYLDATGHKMCWRMEADGKPSIVFHSIGEMEEYLEHLLENRSRIGLTGMTPCVKRRAKVISERQRSRTNGTPMLFQSRINGM